jgi:modification methylase
MIVSSGYRNKVFYKSSEYMEEIPDDSIRLVITSPPYFNVKDYSKDGYQKEIIAISNEDQIGDIDNYKEFIGKMIPIWKECCRVLVPNGKLIINSSMMPMLKNSYSTHFNRHVFNISNDIEQSILSNISKMYLLDLYIWDRSNSSKNLMFGSYPHPPNFYAQNTIEFINVFVKKGDPVSISKDVKEKSKLTLQEWTSYTKQIWNIPIPNKKDVAYSKHSAIMPEEIISRCIKLYSFVDDIILDPFAGSGTTLKVAKELKRNYVGYEINKEYQITIDDKINSIPVDIYEDFWENKKSEIKQKSKKDIPDIIDLFTEKDKDLTKKWLNNLPEP